MLRRWSRSFVVLFTLTIWFGAARHCTLEAAGVLADSEAGAGVCCPDSIDDCHADGCKLVESVAYRTADAGLPILAPGVVDLSWLFSLAWPVSFRDDAGSASVRASWDLARSWRPAWHFDRRSVAAPGAPSGLVS